jgi:hypothetical protein
MAAMKTVLDNFRILICFALVFPVSVCKQLNFVPTNVVTGEFVASGV